MTEAAEIGTRKVIAEHSTIGIVVTTDGSITDIPREDYLEAEERVITELKELGKPFLVVLNSSYPNSDRAQAIRADIASRYDVTCVCADCLELDEAAVTAIIKGVLYEFPVKELDLFLPPWVDALPYDHPIKSGLYTAIREGAAGMHRIRDVERTVTAIGECDTVSSARITSISLGTGLAAAQLELPRGLFYDTLSEQSGFTIHDDGDLMELLSSLAHVKTEYDKVAGALEEVKSTGYGHRGAQHRRAGAGGAGDRQAGGTLWRAPEGLRPLHPHDPCGHRNRGLAHRGQRKAERGDGQFPASGVRGGHQGHLAVQYLRQVLP